MRGFSFLLGRIALAATVVGGVLATAACGALLGINDGMPIDEGGTDSTSSGSDDVATPSDAPPDRTADATPMEDGAPMGDAAYADRSPDAPDAAQSNDTGSGADGKVDSSDGAVETGVDGGAGTDGGDAGSPETGTGGDAAPPDGGDACTSDPNWCATHCGPGPDTCGVTRPCTDNCVAPWVCDPTSNQCQCQHDPNWCNGRCGVFNDNCGTPFDCMSCTGGVACNASNTCGCTPAPNPCGSMQCGQTQDSCMHPVSCGNNGACASGGICDPDAGTCCTPLSNPCGGRCSGTVDNGCNQQIDCSAPCATGEVCDSTGTCVCPPISCGNSCGQVSNGCSSTMCGCTSPYVCDTTDSQCCLPNGGCSPTCIDNCGQPAPCCPDSGPPPDGGPPDDGGACNPPGGDCPGGMGCCTGLACTATQVCAGSCSTTFCMTLADCCFGFTSCGGVILPDGGMAAMGTGPGMCQ